MRKLILITSFIFISVLSFSQSIMSDSKIKRSNNTNGWSIQLSFGPNLAFTDIKQYNYYPIHNYNNEWRFGTSLIIQRDLSNVFGIRGQGLYGKLAGTRRENNRFFEATIFDYSLQTTINFNNLFSSYNQYRPLNIYGIIGIGISNWETELQELNSGIVIGGNGRVNSGLLKMTTEAFVPVGLGLSFRLSDKININAESTIRITNSDILDATEGGSKYDMYSFTSLGVTYKLGKRSYKRIITKKGHIPQRQVIKEEKEKVNPTVKEFANKKISTKPLHKVKVNNDIPKYISTGNSYIVRTMIEKGDITGPATFRQIFPAGFSIEPLAKSGGEFTFAGQILTINWDNIPSTSKIAIAYKLSGNNLESGIYPISGIFTYTKAGISELIPFKNTIYVTKAVDDTEKVSIAQPSIKTKTNKHIEYRVQVRAKYHKHYPINNFKSRYDISDEIFEDYNNGYYIYTIGSFVDEHYHRQNHE